MWRDSNESCGFVPLLVHKHYIEHLSNSSYRFIEENYIAIIIVIELSPSPINIYIYIYIYIYFFFFFFHLIGSVFKYLYLKHVFI